MKKPRIDPWALNPEKLLTKNAKKDAAAEWPTLYEMGSITFSRTRRKALIARLKENAPHAFYRGLDLTKLHRAITALQHEIKQELASLGIARDEMLVTLLFYDVIRDPAWRRAGRATKS